jgi:hypothetical protein
LKKNPTNPTIFGIINSKTNEVRKKKNKPNNQTPTLQKNQISLAL